MKITRRSFIEGDLALWREYFPDQPPYCAFDACGLRFVKWNGACDGIIDAVQEKWIVEDGNDIRSNSRDGDVYVKFCYNIRHGEDEANTVRRVGLRRNAKGKRLVHRPHGEDTRP